jgi:hypothetical protein
MSGKFIGRLSVVMAERAQLAALSGPAAGPESDERHQHLTRHDGLHGIAAAA